MSRVFLKVSLVEAQLNPCFRDYRPISAISPLIWTIACCAPELYPHDRVAHISVEYQEYPGLIISNGH